MLMLGWTRFPDDRGGLLRAHLTNGTARTMCGMRMRSNAIEQPEEPPVELRCMCCQEEYAISIKYADILGRGVDECAKVREQEQAGRL
jgi:hypothetical protein